MVKKKICLRTLRTKFKLFYDAFTQNDASIKAIGSERSLLYQRLGHTYHEQDRDFDGLVLRLNQFIIGSDAARESEVCTDQMLEFTNIGLNPTDMSKWTTSTALMIEKKFEEAQAAMLDYWLAVVIPRRQMLQKQIKSLGVPTLAEMRFILNNNILS